ncbi:hypothetical protein RI129_006272 [Pyrocoelia pectoralis]|uniref:Regulatory protein zeste n=1 Tax=Pyrocoelia pectoralis TaxID=417401 RepID=A0AAN7ZI77_9COLE
MKKRVGYISNEQKNTLMELMDKYPNLINGRFSSTFTKKDGQNQWHEIASILNAIPGAKKDWIHWRKRWGKKSDYKSHNKESNGDIIISRKSQHSSRRPPTP